MLTAHDGSVVTRGTKELINNVKRIKRENGIANEFIDEAELVPNIDITDPPIDPSIGPQIIPT
jgi:hypothetical protein